jgi:hypothetical protein
VVSDRNPFVSFSEAPEDSTGNRVTRTDLGLLGGVIGAAALIAALMLHLPFGANLLLLAGGLVLAFLVLVAAYAAGAFVLESIFRFSGNPENPRDVATPLVAGLGILSFVVYVLAALGVYHSYFGWGAMCAGCVAGARPLRAQWRSRPWALSERPVTWAAAPALVALIVAAGSPVVFWDSHSYHLAIPEIISATGHLPLGLSYIYGYYAVACECLYALVLVPPFGEAATQVLNVAFFVFAAAAAAAPLRPRERIWGRTLLACTPGLVMLAFLPKNTGLLALSTMAAFHNAFGDEANESGGELGGPGPQPLLAGLTLGVALATHHAALIVVPVLAAVLFRRSGPRAALAALGVALLFPAPVYLRNLMMTGNPTYPFLVSIFGGTAPAPILIAADPGTPGIGRIIAAITAPWVQFEPEGVGSTLGLAVPLGIVLAIIARRIDRPLAQRAIAGIIIFAVGAVIFGRPRYGITGFFLLAPLAARGLSALPALAAPLLFIQALAAALLLLAGPLRPLDAGFTMNAAEYRARVVPTWPIAAVASEHLPDTARIASAGILRPYGWGGKLEECSENMLPAFGEILPGASSGRAVARALRDRGFGYWAVDFREMDRLEKGYGYLRLAPRDRAVLNELIALSRPIASGRQCALYELPSDAPESGNEGSP